MIEYKYEITIESDSKEEADSIIFSMMYEHGEFIDFDFAGIDESVVIRRRERTKLIEEFAKTESGKLMDAYMKKWRSLYPLYRRNPEEKIAYYTDIIEINQMLKKENIKNVFWSDDCDFYRLSYDFNGHEDYWNFTEGGMDASIENSKNNY